MPDGFRRQPVDAVLRTQMDVGLDKVRRRFTAVPERLQMTFLLSAAQRDTWRSFYIIDIKHGSLRFDWTAPDTNVAAQFRVVGAPVLTPVQTGLVWYLTLEVEQLP